MRFCDKIDILEKDAPTISSIMRIVRERYEINMKAKKLEEKIERLYDKIINSMETFYLNTKMSGILTGWCEICRKGSVDNELKIFVKNFIKSKIEGLLRGAWATRITSY
jgi:high-affinity K+ transport system ATPase subunit B